MMNRRLHVGSGQHPVCGHAAVAEEDASINLNFQH